MGPITIVVLGLMLVIPVLTTVQMLEAPNASSSLARLVDIGDGRQLWLRYAGETSSPVVAKAGYRSPVTVWTDGLVHPDDARAMVLEGIELSAQVVTYERPRAAAVIDDVYQSSRSDPWPMDRTAESVISDLHSLLLAANRPRAYVMVGHSLRGLSVPLYAATHPKEIVAMVLVDARSMERQSLLTPERWTTWVRFNSLVPPSMAGGSSHETIHFEAASSTNASQPSGSLPLVVLAHEQPFGISSVETGLDASTFDQAWTCAQERLAMLVATAQLIVAKGTPHYIQQKEPELVVAAIESVIAGVRAPGRWGPIDVDHAGSKEITC